MSIAIRTVVRAPGFCRTRLRSFSILLTQMQGRSALNSHTSIAMPHARLAVTFDSKRHFYASAPARAPKRDLYEVLGVAKNASTGEIKKAYFKLAKQFHPDSFQSASDAEKTKAKERFVEIQEAYELLSDEKRRAMYDQFGHTGEQANGGGGGAGPFGGQYSYAGGNQSAAFAEDLLRDLFGRAGGRGAGFGQQTGRRTRQSSGGFGVFDDLFGAQSDAEEDVSPDITTRLSIPFMDAIRGTRRTIGYAAWSRCGTCSGSGQKPNTKPKVCTACGGAGEQLMNHGGFRIVMQCQQCGGAGSFAENCSTCRGHGRVKERRETAINIPAGIDSGERLHFAGRGHSLSGNRQGNLYVVINVMDPAPSESMFKRKGANLTVEVPLTFYQAIFGDTVQVPTLDGPMVKVKLPSGTQPNEKRVLSGYGVQKLSQPQGVKGDLNVVFKVIIPKVSDLPLQQLRLLEQFRAIAENRSVPNPPAPATSPPDTSEKDDRDVSEAKKTAASDEGTDNGFIKKTIDKLKDSLCDRDGKDNNNNKKKTNGK